MFVLVGVMLMARDAWELYAVVYCRRILSRDGAVATRLVGRGRVGARPGAGPVHLLHVISFAVWPRATRPRRQPGTARAPPAPARLAGAQPGDVKRRRRPLER